MIRQSMLTPSPTSASASKTLVPGELLLGRYQVLRHVASGGMGQVFEALDVELDQRIALKTLHPRISDNKEALERFKREIRLARQVTHPNVCRLFDFGTYHAVRGGEEREVLFLTMELLEGESLASYVARRGPLPLDEVTTIIGQTAQGLAAAHEQGIIHRDLNSRNIHLVMASSGLRAVITDFGLARQITSTSGSTLTLGGDLLGTPAYMAPEQLEGGEVSPATDLYALGVVIYEMLTGRLPFEGDTPISVAMQHLRNSPLSPRELVPDLDPRWEAIALRCLEKHPSRRFASAAQLREAVLDQRARPSEIHPPRRSWRLAATTGALLLLVVSAVATWLDRAPEPVATSAASAVVEPAQAAPKTAEPANAEAARWYEEGRERLRTHRYYGARLAFEQAIAADPRFAMAQVRLAQAQLSSGDRKGAREAARKGLTLAGQLTREHQLLVQALYHETNDSWSEAIEVYRELVSLDPGSLEYGLALADSLMLMEASEEVKAQLTALRQLPPPQGDDPRLDLLEAGIAHRVSDFKAQRQLAERAIAKSIERSWPALEARARLRLAAALLRLDSTTASAEQARRARELFVAVGEPSGEARAMIEEGWALYHQEKHDLAEQLYRQALEKFRSLGNASGVGYSLNRLANVAVATGDLEAARKLYLEAIEIQQEAKDRDLGRTTYNYGVLLIELEEYEKAKTQIEENLSRCREHGDRAGEAIMLNTLGTIALGQGNLPGAALSFGEAAAIHEALGDRSGAIVPLANQGSSSLRLGNLDEAAEQLGRARTLLEETGNLRARPTVMSHFAELDRLQDRLEEAEQTLASLEPGTAPSPAMIEGWLMLQMQSVAVLRARGDAQKAADRARELIAKARAAGLQDLEDWASVELGRALLDLDRVSEAAAISAAIPERQARGVNPHVELERRLLAGLLALTQGHSESARTTLSELRSVAEKQGFYEIELEARFGLCKLEPGTEKTCLEALETEAGQKGFKLLARQVAERRARL